MLYIHSMTRPGIAGIMHPVGDLKEILHTHHLCGIGTFHNVSVSISIVVNWQLIHNSYRQRVHTDKLSSYFGI